MIPKDEESFELIQPKDASRVLRGRIRRPDGPARGTVLCLHGFKGFMHWGFFPELRRRLTEAGFVAVAFNHSGSGIGPDLQNFTEEEAFAHGSFSRELEDIALVREHLATLGLPMPVGLLGHSRGGGTGLIHAAERGDYAAVVTWAAISTVERFSGADLDAWRERGFLTIHNARTGQQLAMDVSCLQDVEANAERLDIRGACARLGSPMLLIHGGADEAVSLSESDALFAAFSTEPARLILPEAGHTFGARHPFDGTPSDLERVFEASLAHFAKHMG